MFFLTRHGFCFDGQKRNSIGLSSAFYKQQEQLRNLIIFSNKRIPKELVKFTITTVFAQGSPVWLLIRTMQWPLKQSPKYAICGNSPARGLWYKTWNFPQNSQSWVQQNNSETWLKTPSLPLPARTCRDVASPTLSRRLPIDGPVMAWHFSSYAKSNRKACEMTPRTTRFLKHFLHVFFARSTFCLFFGQVRILF